MRDYEMSSTAVLAIMARAAHQTVDAEPPIHTDPVALAIARHLQGSSEWASFESLSPALLTAIRSALVLRSRYAEDVLKELATTDNCQYVILGAGFDTFAWRQPAWANNVRIFEVDHPATQARKREIFREIGLPMPPNLQMCGIDFETTSLGDGLEIGGFDPAKLTVVSCLGVSQYLTHQALRETLKFVQTFHPGSSLVLSFVLKDADLDEDARELLVPLIEAASARGEPFLSRFSPEELLRELSAIGYRKVHHFSPKEADGRYFGGRTDELHAPVVEQLIRASV